MQETTSQKSNPLLALFILVLALAVLLFLSQGRSGAGTNLSSFSPRDVAYGQAQQAQAYRTRHPSARNYCVVSIFVEDTTGKVTAGPNQLFYGFGQDSNANHCEQRALQWVAKTGLPQVFRRYTLAKVEVIHIVLFSQVRVCAPCEQSFQAWEEQLQQQVAAQPGGVSVQLHLYVWEITYGSKSGFAPRDYPAGPSTPGAPKLRTTKPVPVQPEDINPVYP